MPARQEQITITFQPLGRKGQFPRGITLLEAARQLGVGLSGICGGGGTCGSCRVVIPPTSKPSLTLATATEASLLEQSEWARGVRLACQACAEADVQVMVPPESLTTSQRTQVEGRQTPVEPDPLVTAHDVALPSPSIEDLRSDSSRLRDELGETLRFDLGVLQTAALCLRQWNWQARAAVRGDEVVAILPFATPLLGLAVDLGTTKLAGYLIDLQSGQTLASTGMMNPQLAYGEDVMARITYALQSSNDAARLQQAATEGVNALAEELCAELNVSTDQIVETVVVGNTAMHHLFLGLSTAPLGLAPYVPVESESLDVRAREVGLNLSPGSMVHLLPNVAGFVGADHVAALLAARMDEVDQPTLLLDIGTNTEICLATGSQMFSCSTASGPAFEGAHIRFGMRAAPGAIERVRLIEGQVYWETVNDQPPVGLCGSGILDAVAELRHGGVLNDRGSMVDAPQVRQGEQGPEFVLVPAKTSGLGREITLSRKDVSEIQLAKAAIATGWQVLLERIGLQAVDLAQVIVAGAFGTYIDVERASLIGMLPAIPPERFAQVGNMAGTGARMSLISCPERARAARIAQQIEYVELTTYPSFQERFTRGLSLSPRRE